jgi:hypothetical protein
MFMIHHYRFRLVYLPEASNAGPVLRSTAELTLRHVLCAPMILAAYGNSV